MAEEADLKVGDIVVHRVINQKGKILRIDHYDVGEWYDDIPVTIVVIEYSRFGYGHEEPSALDLYTENIKPSQVSKKAALQFPCPKCGAGTDTLCTTATGGETDIHAGRKALVTDGN